MFAIYRKNVGGRIHDRYFNSFDKATEELELDVERMCKSGDVITRRLDYMNTSKGFYVYQVDMTTTHGEKASHAILDGYFEDD